MERSLVRYNGPLELSVLELWDRTLERPSSEGGGQSKLVVEERPFRYTPLSVSETAQKHLDKTGDIERVLRYILNAFYVYRETVCREFGAPHYKTDGAYEWPVPVKVSWDSIDVIIGAGEFIYGPIPKNDSRVTITARNGDKIEETKIGLADLIVPGKGIFPTFAKETNVRDIIPEKDELNKTFKYTIDDLRNVGFIFQQSWQQLSLRGYANPLYDMLSDLLKGELLQSKARIYLEQYLDFLSKAYSLPIGKIAENGETPNPDNFFWLPKR